MVNYFPQRLSIAEATALQEELAEEISLRDEVLLNIETLGGAVLYSRGDSITVSLVIVDVEDNFTKFSLKEKEINEKKVTFPAIPSFEGFREGKILSEMIKEHDVPNVFLIGGHGIDHPRKFGLASHVGLALDLSTIGVSRELTSGRLKHEDGRKLIVDNGNVIGEVVRKDAESPRLYVSPGNKISLETSVNLVNRCMDGSLPKPLKMAQENLLNRLKV